MSANRAESIDVDAAARAAPSFVINLCASTSPMALAHPESPELKRFTFFVSRQREDGRERFRLHMGYFASQEAAESLLSVVRDVYPAAWAGPAPTTGVPRRVRSPVPAMPKLATVAQAAPAAPPVPAAAVPESARAPAPALDDMSNVRDVLAQLSETVPPHRAAPLAKPQPVAAKVPAARQTREVSQLNPVQTLRVLEPEPAPEVRVVTPEDTQTLNDIRLDARNNAPPCFAVQLIWSVSPIDVTTLPHLAIFDAYSLYNVEGTRQGRKWYGLRLGFFSDPNSATQVAHYVRSDYQTVAVVPVASKERDHARGGAAARILPRLGDAAVALKPEVQTGIEKHGLDGFELLTDDKPAVAKRDLDDVAAPVVLSGAAPPDAAPERAGTAPLTARARVAAASSPAAKPMGKRVVVRKPMDRPGRAAPGAAAPLESTLEILGASTLSLDESREIINDSAIRKPVDRKQRTAGSRFGKLLSRLGRN